LATKTRKHEKNTRHDGATAAGGAGRSDRNDAQKRKQYPTHRFVFPRVVLIAARGAGWSHAKGAK
jgi:hypothetical protein